MAITALLSCNSKENSSIFYISYTNKNTQADVTINSQRKSSEDVDYSLLKAGDTIFLQSEDIRGSIHINSLVAGTPEKPIVIMPHANNKTKIISGNKVGLHIRNSQNIKIERLHLIGSGRKDGNTKDGLFIENCDNIFVTDIETEGYQKSGLYILKSFNITVDGVYAHNNGYAGVFVSGIYGDKESSKNIILRNCKTDDNPGDPTNLKSHSGNGILLGSCSNSLIEYCSATNNGWDMPRVGNGPVGIWIYDADNILIQYCISYRNKTSKGSEDGGGFDFDGGVTNSTIQYCLSYENEGGSFGLFEYEGARPWYNNTVRYCISENDGLVSHARASVYIWNANEDSTLLKDCYFYNNTIYNDKGAAICFHENSARKNFNFYNNIFISQDDLITGNWQNDTFLANCWYSLNNNGFKIGDINSLEDWAKIYNKELFDGNITGLNILPEFEKSKKTNITDPKQLSSYFVYRLPENSILKTSGLNLSEQFGIITAEKDFNQQKILPNGIGAGQ